MRVKTQALVLHSLAYSENSLVVKLFCRELGLRGYLVSRKSVALYQPLNLLDAVVYETKSSGLHRIAEARLAYCYQSIGILPSKMPPLYLLREILYKTLREESPNPYLFDFVASQLMAYDSSLEPEPDFHIRFLVGYLAEMGLGSDRDDWEQIEPRPSEEVLSYLSGLGQAGSSGAGRKMRNMALDWILNVLAEQFQNLDKLKSLEILRELSELENRSGS
jgi:DNA repair protein RecO (recombination protein O)